MSTSLSLAEKKRLWQNEKYDKFQQISKDKSTIFNYFMVNNDIFKIISQKDYNDFRLIQIKAQYEKMKLFYTSIGSIFVVDQIFLRFLFPKFKIPKYRFTVNVAKYVLLPCIIYSINKEYYMEEYQQFFYKMQDKYSFGFLDFMKANRIFERALAVDRLQQLLDKRQQFDWNGIPQLPQQQSKEDLKKI